MSSKLKSDSVGVISYGIRFPFGVGANSRILPAHLLCQSKGQLKNIFKFKVWTKTGERQRWNKLKGGGLEKQHLRKVKVCRTEGDKEGDWRRGRVFRASGKEDIWGKGEKRGGKRQRNTKTGRRTGIDRESSKVRDSRGKKGNSVNKRAREKGKVRENE